MNMADAKEFRAVNLDPVPGHPLVPKLQLGNQGPKSSALSTWTRCRAILWFPSSSLGTRGQLGNQGPAWEPGASGGLAITPPKSVTAGKFESHEGSLGVDDNRTITCLAALAAALFLSATEPAWAAPNQLRNGGFESQDLSSWLPPEHVEIERVSVEGQTGEAALRVAWQDVPAFTVWAKAGGLLRASSDVLARPLQRDTRYHLSCRMEGSGERRGGKAGRSRWSALQ